MLTGNTILSTSAGTPSRLTLIASSSPSPSPVRLSPVCSTEPSGLVRLLKKMKCESERILPLVPTMRAEASRSKSAPVVVRTSQPRPTSTACSPGASLLSETLPPLLKLTLMMCSSRSSPIDSIDERAVFFPGSLPTLAARPSRRAPRPSGVEAEIPGDAREPGAVALPDGPELPLVAVAVQLAEDHRRLGGGVLGQVVARDLGAVGLVDDPDEGVAHLSEGLAGLLPLVDGDREHHAGGLCGQTGEIHPHLLVITAALAGEVVAAVLDGAVGAAQVVEEDEVFVRDRLAVGVADDRAGVQVESLAIGGPGVPAEPDHDRGQARGGLGERHVAALGEIDGHR